MENNQYNLRSRDVAKLLDVSINTVNKWCRNGGLPHAIIGGTQRRAIYAFKLEDIENTSKRKASAHSALNTYKPAFVDYNKPRPSNQNRPNNAERIAQLEQDVEKLKNFLRKVFKTQEVTV